MSFSSWIYDYLLTPNGKIPTRITFLFTLCLRELVKLKLFPVNKAKYLPVTGRFKIKFPQKFSIKMEVSEHDEIARTLFWVGVTGFEYETVNLFIQLAQSAHTILDIGANNGYFGLIAAKVNKSARVFAFEPVPGIYQQIQRNAQLNRLPNLMVLPVAVSDKNGSTTLFIPKQSEFPTSASLLKSFRPNTLGIRCDTIRLDSFIQQYNIKPVDLVKIDTEATEPEVIKGMHEILATYHPDIICEVLAGRTEKQLEKVLEPFGYYYYHIENDGPRRVQQIVGDPTYRYKNYLFSVRQL